MAAGGNKTLLSAATTLPGPPVSWASVAAWRGRTNREFELKLWSTAAASFTSLYLAGAVQRAQTIADDDVDGVTAGSDTLTVTGHAYKNGDGPVTFSSTLTLPGGISAATNYWITVVDANTIKLSTSFANWLDQVFFDITSAGTGTVTIADVQTGETLTKRVHWLFISLLGPAEDGVLTLGASLGYSKRFVHTPERIAYAVIGTVGSGALSGEIALEASTL